MRRLLIGGLVSKTGDWLTVGALMGWVYQETASTGSVALLMLVRLAPPILGGGVAAAFVDRVRRERLLVIVELLRAVALATVVTGLISGMTVLVFAAIGVSGLLAAISQVAVSALIPGLVPAEELPAANGLNGVIESTAMATGAIAGGLLLSLVGVVPALIADLSTFVLAAALFAGISATAAAGAATADDVVADDAPKPRLRDLLSDRTITTTVGALCVTVVAGGLVNATLPRFLTELGLGAGAYGYGFGAVAIGLALGGGIAGAMRVENADAALMGRALFATAVTFCMLARRHQCPARAPPADPVRRARRDPVGGAPDAPAPPRARAGTGARPPSERARWRGCRRGSGRGQARARASRVPARCPGLPRNHSASPAQSWQETPALSPSVAGNVV